MQDMHLLKLLLLVFVSLSDANHNFTPFNTSVMPITKDARTSIYKVGLGYWGIQSDYLLDLDAPFTWTNCVVHVPEVACAAPECNLPISCSQSSCIEARSYVNPICPSLNITAKYGCGICAVTPVNPVAKSCKISQLTSNFLSLSTTNGRNPTTSPMFLNDFVYSCAPSSLMRSLPKDIVGVAAFSWSTLAFPRQISYLNVADKFAVCLPSSSSTPGVAFLGEGPFYFLPFPNLDVRTILSYTPMIRKTSNSLGYYIRINRMSIKGRKIPLPSSKRSYVKLSTILPYTTLRSDIYKAFLVSFSKAAKEIPRVKAVQPFRLCMKAGAVGSIRTGFHVPKIDLEMESGKIWTISGDNSMKNIGNGVACLAFVDGGSRAKDPFVIGTFQMENNFLFMDLVNQRLGFSSSLLARGTSCSSFNSTITPK